MITGNLRNIKGLPIYKLEMQELVLEITAELPNFVSATSLQNEREGVK